VLAGATVLLLLALPRSSSAQSDWARGDAAFKRKEWARAESSYARRAHQPKPPSGLLANLATARALQQRADSVEQELSRLAARPDAAGRMSGYNLGTLLGGRGEYDKALAELRRTLERDPDDADARWNYEWLTRQKKQAEQKPEPSGGKPKPEPEPPQPQPDPQPGQGTPQPDQPQGGPADNPSKPAPVPDAPGMQQSMSRQQAEQLLGSLGDLERIERQERRRNQARREKRGKDW
jgi:tetratricopeptide (TPR) repeat protein